MLSVTPPSDSDEDLQEPAAGRTSQPLSGQVTGELERISAPAQVIEPSTGGRLPSRGRTFGVRLWLALVFAGIGTVVASAVFFVVSETSDRAAADRSRTLAAGTTVDLAGKLGAADEKQSGPILSAARNESFAAWVFSGDGELVTNERVGVANITLDQVPERESAVSRAQRGLRVVEGGLPGDVTVVALPIIRRSASSNFDGVVLSYSRRPKEVKAALATLRGERLTAVILSVLVSALVGFIVASILTTRLKKLALGAGEIARGHLHRSIQPRGRDEIGDLGRALDSMRVSLSKSFDALSSERDRLRAILTALSEAVIVFERDGLVRFANAAAADVVEDEELLEALRPWQHQAEKEGGAEHPALRVGERFFALQARDLPAENAALVVVRDRTEELRREMAEREFVSNAAHELRNPIAGISGAIEVLRAGAKDDPEARDHFLNRLSEDVERVSRLTRSLLTLARMEAVGSGEAEVVSVEIAAQESVASVGIPEGIEVKLDLEEDLGARADPVLLRQVIIGLLTNAFKNTPTPGTVTLRASKEGAESVLIEVTDTGTGISEEDVDRVFERFYRGSGSLEQEGFGLGLSIARRMVDVMGGEIGVESQLGDGSTFWIRLLVAEPSTTPIA